MKIEITRKQLKELDACQENLDKFEEEFGQSVEFDWTPAKQLWLMQSKWRLSFGWLLTNKILPLWSMYKADLRGADLSGADLEGANL